MYIYLIIFAISIFIIGLAEKFRLKSRNKKKSKVFYLFIAFIGILLPSILAGLRDYSIGTDVLVYGNDWFNRAVNATDFNLYTRWATSSSIGYLYAVFNFVVSRFTANPHYFYFYLNLMEGIIVYSAIFRNKDILNVTDGWATYLFLFYNFTLNILRNGMALCILLWGFYYIRKQKPIKYLIVVYIATLFHATAIIGIIIYILYYLLNKSNSQINKLFTLLVTGLSVLFFQEIGHFLIENEMISERYFGFLENGGRGGFILHLFVFSLPILGLYFKVDFSKLKVKRVFYLLEEIVIVSFLMSFFNMFSSALSRITNYFDFFYVLAVPYIFDQQMIFKYKNFDLNKLVMYVYLIIYWLITYMWMRSGETVPFVFMRS